MRSGFTKGLIAGSIIGAAMSMMMGPQMSSKSRQRMMRRGRGLVMKTGDVLENIVSMLK